LVCALHRLVFRHSREAFVAERPAGGKRRVRAPAGVSTCQSPRPIPTLARMEKSQLAEYVPVLLLAVVAVAFTAGMLVFSVLLGKRGRRTHSKDVPYECGMVPVGEGSPRLSVKFYLVAMLFILFDIEVVFLYPWAVVYKPMLADPATKNLILASMVSFLAVLFVGYLYALKKRAFEWKT
jgi:NADH-quinone oxidoreductase subunit A